MVTLLARCSEPFVTAFSARYIHGLERRPERVDDAASRGCGDTKREMGANGFLTVEKRFTLFCTVHTRLC